MRIAGISGRLHTSGRIALTIIVALAALATFLMSSPASPVSAQEEDEGVIPGCVNRYNGNLRVPRISGQCASTEYAIEFTSKAGADNTEQELLDRIDELEDELNERVDNEVAGLNTRIDNEVETINLRIDNEVTTLNGLINALGSSFTDIFGDFTSCFNETFDYSLPLPDINMHPIFIELGEFGTYEVFPGFNLVIPDVNLTILDPVGVVNCLGNVDLNPND